MIQKKALIVDGGSEHMGSENFGKMAGHIVATKIPEFMDIIRKKQKVLL